MYFIAGAWGGREGGREEGKVMSGGGREERRGGLR